MDEKYEYELLSISMFDLYVHVLWSDELYCSRLIKNWIELNWIESVDDITGKRILT